jgi:ABC-type branched-subunit amino acid transport system ATPase component/predicted MFS family arabinose efflux permease
VTAPVMDRPDLPAAPAPAEIPDPAHGRKGLRAIARSWTDLRHTPYGTRPLAVTVFAGLATGVTSTAAGYAGPFILEDLRISIQSIISLGSVIGFFLIFAQIGLGWWADRHKRVPLLALGNIISGVFSMITSAAQNIFTYGAPTLAGDVAAKASDVPSFSLMADYYPPESRGKVFAVLNMVRSAAALPMIILGALLLDWIGWRRVFLIGGAITVLVGLVMLVLLKEPVRGYMERRAMGADEDVARQESEPQSFGEGWRTVWAVRTLRRLFIALAVGAPGTLIYATLSNFLLAEEYGLKSAISRALVLGPPSLIGALIGAFVGGALIDRLSALNPSRVLLIVGSFGIVNAFGLLGLSTIPPIWTLMVFGFITAFGAALIGPAAQAITTQIIPPSVRTQGIQMMNLAMLPAIIFFLPMSGQLLRDYGYSGALLFSVPFALAGAFLNMSAASFFEFDRRNAFAAAMADHEWRVAKASGQGKMLVCRDVDVEYDGVQVLFGVDFDVEEGQIIALLGTNGAGKSTLLRAISGTQEASAGAIVFDGRDITHMPPHETAARGVIHMPGGRGIFPGLSVRENIVLGNWMNTEQSAEEQQARVAEVFELFPILRERADELAASLSGGEQQMLSLAQAFLAKPRLLMIDELSLGLSPAVVGQLLEIVRAIHARGTTIIVVEQSVNVALTLAEKAIFMEKGEVKFFGNTADLLARPDILRAVYVKGTGALTSATPSTLRSERERRALELGEARPVLEVEALTKRFGGITAVDGVSFALREGEVLGVIGPNGSGKTTTFDLISGFQLPDAGAVRYQGVDITDLPPEERARRKLVRRFQDARLFPSLTVFETLLVALDQRLEVRSALLAAGQLPQARRAEKRVRLRAEKLIELLELGAYRDKFVKELSTGLRRIVDLACVLATEPQVLLLDEPSSGIAQAEAEGLAPLLRRVRFETGCSILIIEHDMPLISAVSDELIALDQGRFVTRGRPAEVLEDERVVESYLGTTEEAVHRSGSIG